MNPLSDPGLYALLLSIDEELASPVRARGCPDCGGKFHDGGFERKPRGCSACPARLRQAFFWRTSYDCSHCRHRTKPPSVRFLDRRVYLAAVFALVSPRGQPSVLPKAVGVAERTLDRWRRWWREVSVTSRVWRTLRGRLLPPIDTQTLPLSLAQRMSATQSLHQLAQYLKQLASLSTARVQ